jgi:predicted amidophosphoribosyltransferase
VTTDLLLSIETSSAINDDINKILDKPFISDGIKKINNNFKMKNISLNDRSKLTDIFYSDFISNGENSICVVDDFITTGTSFKHAFNLLPSNVKKIGVCLYLLRS